MIEYTPHFDDLAIYLHQWTWEEGELFLYSNSSATAATVPEFRQALKEAPGSFNHKMKQIDAWLGEFGFVVFGYEVEQQLKALGIDSPPPLVGELKTDEGEFFLNLHHRDVRARTEVRRRSDIALRLLLSLRNELLQEAGLATMHEPDGEQAQVPVAESAQDDEHSRGQEKMKIELPQIALLYVFRGKTINGLKHANEIAQSYGLKSGERLLKFFRRYAKPEKLTRVERTDIEGRNTKTLNKIELIESVMKILKSEPKALEEATKALEQLKEAASRNDIKV